MPYCIQALLNKWTLNEQQETEILLWTQYMLKKIVN